MGCMFRLLVGPPGGAAAAVAAQAELAEMDAQLSRFRPDSELSRLNADPRPVVPASPLLRATVRAALWAAQRTAGLVDATLVGALEQAGYAASRAGAASAPLADALARAPERRPAQPHPDAPWRAVVVDDRAGTIARPPGLRLDSGGVGKGLAADLIAHRLGAHERFAVDAAGDVRVGGTRTAARPHEIDIAHPWREEPLGTLRIAAGAVATSGIDSRLWATADDKTAYAHHLLDPATGESAWTGLVAATALAPTALEAETLAKAALLSGPRGAGRWLAEHGGVVVHDDGEPEWIGPARPQRRTPPERGPQRLRIALPRIAVSAPGSRGGRAA